MAKNQDTTLKVVKGGDLRRRFRRRVNGVYQSFVGVTAYSQIRDKPGGTLLLDMGPYFSVNEDDDTMLDLLVPGSVTATLTTDAVWDIFFDRDYITGGCVDLMRPVTVP